MNVAMVISALNVVKAVTVINAVALRVNEMFELLGVQVLMACSFASGAILQTMD